MNLLIDRLKTPIGELVIIVDEAGQLRTVDWTDHAERFARSLHHHVGDYVFVEQTNPFGLTTVFAKYFAGELRAIDALVATTGGTPFQKRVWAALRTIPSGQTISYSQLAHRIGNPAAVRAVGLANGANPISIVVPCHRVIGANGSLTGYGGGIERKRWLLAHEGATANLSLNLA